jgi:mRNA interferase MazF
MTEAAWQPDAGDLIWTDVTPSRGREKGRGCAPALVVSSKVFTVHTGLAVVCPISSRVRSFPTSVVLPPGLPVAGEILTSHVRSIDTVARPVSYAGASIGSALSEDVRAKLAAFITI